MAEQGRLEQAIDIGHSCGLVVHGGHGLTYRNIDAIAKIAEIEEHACHGWHPYFPKQVFQVPVISLSQDHLLPKSCQSLLRKCDRSNILI